MSNSEWIASQLTYLQCQKSLTLCWHSVDTLLMLCWRSVDALLTLIFRCSDNDFDHIAYKGGQYFDYGYRPYHSPWIIKDATHKIVDALLTLIFRLWLLSCHCVFCVKRLPVRSIWIIASKSRPNWRPKIVDSLLTLCWHSVDTLLTLCWRFVDALLTLCWRSFLGVATMTLTILPIKAANTSIMGTGRTIALGLLKMQHTKSLTLCWRSFSDCDCDHVVVCFAYRGCQYAQYW